jgi:hypothetical protein
MLSARESLHLPLCHSSVGNRGSRSSPVGVEGVVFRLGQLQSRGDIMGNLADHVFPDGRGSERLPLGPSPPNPPGKLVEVGVDLPQVHPNPIRKSAMSRDKENRVPLVTVLLYTAVCNLVLVTRSDHLLQNQAQKAKSTEDRHNGDGLPDEPVGGLHVPQHEGLDMRFIEDGGLGLDVGVEPLISLVRLGNSCSLTLYLRFMMLFKQE